MAKRVLLAILAVSAVIPMNGCLVVPRHQPMPVEQAYEQPPVVEDEYVAPVIVYDEPVYLPPPIVVNYRYDYYAYENRGGFVNIVFYQNGRRIRSEPWQVDGRRMTPMHIDAWRQTHKIERARLEHHRQMLEQQHHIRHADTYYGVRPVQTRPAPNRQYMNQRVDKPHMQPVANQPPQQRGNPMYRQPGLQPQQQRVNPPVPQVQQSKPVQQRPAQFQQKPGKRTDHP